MRILFIFAWLSVADAASTTTWELNTFQDFVKGKFAGVALTRDGRLERAPAMKVLFDPEESAIWSVAAATDGRVYLGTGPRGKLFEVDATGKGKLLWTAPQPMIFAVTVDAKGVVYAATSPDGRVYRIENGRATEYFNPQAKYIWALATSADGRLFVATGDQGKVFAVTSSGRGEVYYDTGQAHVTALAEDGQGRLLAGTEPNGILYRIAAKDKAFVLYDAALPEIRAVVAGADGSLYVAALGGSLSKKTAAATNPATPMVSGAPISITVTDDAQAGLDLKPKEAKPAAGGVTPAVTSALVPTVEYAGVEKAAIYRIRPDNTVETLWTSKEENVYDLLEQDGALLFATDLQGRIYRRTVDNQLSLMAQTEQGETTRLVSVKGGLLAATANRGQLFRLTPSEQPGQYESPVHDASTVARWGRLVVTGGGASKFETRSGNTVRPDRTWSDWEALAADGKLQSPAARYVQWKAGVVDAVDAARLAYLPQNTPPVMKSITVVGQTVGASPGSTKPAAAAAAATAAYTLTVTDTGETGPAASAGTPTQNVVRSSTRQLVIVWQGEDGDGDPLQYTLSYRGEGERNWKMLKSNTGELALTVDADVFADGRYWFRVVASDKMANTAESAREAELVSGPVVVDNTPPVFREVKANGRLAYTLTAQDNLSELRRCEYSLDAGSWVLLEAEDGVTDSLTESFQLVLPSLTPGEHTLTFRVFDGAGNSAARKLLVE